MLLHWHTVDMHFLNYSPSSPLCRDRVGLFWKDLSSHLSRLMASAAQSKFLLERGVVSVLLLALRLLGRGEFPVIQVCWYMCT